MNLVGRDPEAIVAAYVCLRASSGKLVHALSAVNVSVRSREVRRWTVRLKHEIHVPAPDFPPKEAEEGSGSKGS